MWVAARCAPGRTWAATCDARDARAAWDVRARAEAARGVGPPASVLCPAGTARLRRLVVFPFAFLRIYTAADYPVCIYLLSFLMWG